MEKKYIYHVNMDDMEDSAIFHLLDRLGLIKQSNYEGNGWIKMELDKQESEIFDKLADLDEFAFSTD